MTTFAFRLYLTFVFVVVLLVTLLALCMLAPIGWWFAGLIALLSGLVALWMVVEP